MSLLTFRKPRYEYGKWPKNLDVYFFATNLSWRDENDQNANLREKRTSMISSQFKLELCRGILSAYKITYKLKETWKQQSAKI